MLSEIPAAQHTTTTPVHERVSGRDVEGEEVLQGEGAQEPARHPGQGVDPPSSPRGTVVPAQVGQPRRGGRRREQRSPDGGLGEDLSEVEEGPAEECRGGTVVHVHEEVDQGHGNYLETKILIGTVTQC